MDRRLSAWLAGLVVIGMVFWGCGKKEPSGESRSVSDVIDDASTTAAVKLALAFEPGVRATEIDVDSDRGTVTLNGEVGSEAERQLARKVAEDVGGVKEVVQQIHVRE